MKKTYLIYSILVALVFAPAIALAVNVSVPQSTGYGQVLIGNATGGSYTPVATSTLGISSSGGGIADPFTHPTSAQSATTSLMLLFGQASTSQFTATSSVYLATLGGNVGIGTTSPTSPLTVHGTIWADSLGTTGASIFGTPTLTSFAAGAATPQPNYLLWVATSSSVSSGGNTIALVTNADYEGSLASQLTSGFNGGAVLGSNASVTLTGTNNGGGLRNIFAVANKSNGYGVTQMSSVVGTVNVSGTLASSTNAYNFLATTPAVSANDLVTNSYAYGVQGVAQSGTITNRYGFHADSLIAGTNRYAFSQDGTTDLNYYMGKSGFGTTSPFADLSVHANNGDTNTTLFAIGSSTASATSTLFQIDNTGNITTAMTGTQCVHEVNGLLLGTGSDCGAGGSSFSYPFPILGLGTTSPLMITASTTIGDGTQIGGLTINGGATTTGMAEFTKGWLTYGAQTLFYASSTNNWLCIGINVCGNSATTSLTQSDNIAIGNQALKSNTSGAFNFGLGFQSLTGNTTGGQNVAVGIQSAVANTTGSNSTCVGFKCLASASKPGFNIAIGDQAGFHISTGYGNVIISNLDTAGGALDLTTGANNIGIGNNILFPSPTANNQLNIGNILYGVVAGTSTPTLPLQTPTTGTIGVGTSTPFGEFAIHANNGMNNPGNNLLIIASSTATATTTTFAITNTGQVFSSSTAPTVSSGSVDGTMLYGRVQGCTSACTVTWPSTRLKIPSCIVQEETGSVVNSASFVPSVTNLVVTQTSLGTFDYECFGP